MARWLALLGLLLFLPLSVGADERVTDQAEWTIRRLITNNVEWTRVSFRESKEEFLSFSEARVVGEGMASDRDGWDAMPFRFSVKVHRKDLRTRDARVEFADGRVLTSRDDWEEPVRPEADRIRFISPRWLETIYSRDITFRGASTGRNDVTVHVYDRRGREVAKRSVRPDGRGNWSVRIRLNEGTYRAVATTSRWSHGEEVRFAVGRVSGDWGGSGGWGGWGGSGGSGGFGGSGGSGGSGGFGGSGGSGGWGGSGGSTQYRVSIDRPRNGETIRDGNMQASGSATSREVDVRVYRGSKIAHRSKQRVNGGRWSARASLVPGNYTIVVEAVGGRGSRESRFFVR